MASTNEATLFEILGVEPTASDEAVEQAWQGHFQAAGASHDQIPQEVRHAYQVLQSAGRRAWYSEMLHAAETRQPITVRPHEFLAFQRSCELTALRSFPEPKLKDAYQVRASWQEDPNWSTPTEPHILPPTQRQRFWRALAAVFLFQSLRGKSPAQKLALVFLYIIVVLPTGTAAVWGVSELRNARRRALESSVQELNALATEQIRALDTKLDDLARSFTDITGVPYARCGDPAFPKRPDVYEAIGRNPTAKDAWEAACRASPDAAELQRQRSYINTAAGNVAERKFLPQDRDQLEKTVVWLKASLEELAPVQSNIEHIRKMIAAERSGRTNGARTKEELKHGDNNGD